MAWLPESESEASSSWRSSLSSPSAPFADAGPFCGEEKMLSRGWKPCSSTLPVFASVTPVFLDGEGSADNVLHQASSTRRRARARGGVCVRDLPADLAQLGESLGIGSIFTATARSHGVSCRSRESSRTVSTERWLRCKIIRGAWTAGIGRRRRRIVKGSSWARLRWARSQ